MPRPNGDRLGHRAELTAQLATLLGDQDGEELCRRLLTVGVPAGPVRDVAEVWADAHTRPGRPGPGVNARSRLAAANGRVAGLSSLHSATHRRC